LKGILAESQFKTDENRREAKRTEKKNPHAKSLDNPGILGHNIYI
jgi:hypothetical protein